MVDKSAELPNASFDNNVIGTFTVLEACRKKQVKHVVFCSTSTVYGEAKVFPTPEKHLCEPISNYGAGKLACEAYLSSYAHTYGIKGTVLRYANIYGERSTHGVMYDFYHKLKKNQKQLEILGDGKQFVAKLFKSYVKKHRGIKLIFGKPYSPKGRGKIEAYHKVLYRELISLKKFKSLSDFRKQLWTFDRMYNYWRKQ